MPPGGVRAERLLLLGGLFLGFWLRWEGRTLERFVAGRVFSDRSTGQAARRWPFDVF